MKHFFQKLGVSKASDHIKLFIINYLQFCEFDAAKSHTSHSGAYWRYVGYVKRLCGSFRLLLFESRPGSCLFSELFATMKQEKAIPAVRVDLSGRSLPVTRR